MKILAVGLNHKTASVEVREKLAFDATGTTKALKQLKHRHPQSEFVLLSTCNRVEIYAAAEDIKKVNAQTIVHFEIC
ncbi:MAG: hypothetical protein E4H40_03245 [Candidatus Brocadiia bacterium]|nr:MAG: hypothetical protein E4H40_03245 [Candidatus Brocadiia bacterium]